MVYLCVKVLMILLQGASSFTSQKEEKVEMLTQRINDLVEQVSQ